MNDYALMGKQVAAFAEEEANLLPLLANTAAILYDGLSELNWAGFYLRQGDDLLLGPFQGKPACIRIPYGKGVCGTCLAEDRVQRVADVHAFPGHIACDSASNSEIVLPLHARDTEAKVIGVLDIDSPVYDRFSAEDEAGLAAIVRILEDKMERDLSWLR